MKVVLTGGGTAGHVFPAISIGSYLRENMDAELYYIGNKKYIESKLAMQNAIPFYSIDSKGFEGSSKLEKYGKFAINNSKGVIQAIKILRQIKPDCVIGTGGFVSAPVLTAAIMLKIPFYIHEQNSVMGKVNKLFKDKAKKVFHSFPISEDKNAIHVSCPVRFNEELKENGEYVLFVGGSGGSKKVNQAAVNFATENPNIPCILVSGRGLYADIRIELQEKNIKNLELINYADDMLELYKKARIVVCRSGAGTIFEIANLNIPMILIPLPTSAENHQLKNAEYFSSRNAAILIQEDEYLERKLKELGKELYESKEKRKKIKENLKKLAKTTTSEEIAKQIVTKEEVK